MSSPDAKPASLQRRLALELSLALGLMLVALFLVLDQLVDRELYARMDTGLLERSRTIAAFLHAHPEPAGLDELGRLMPEYEVPGHTDFFELLGSDGTTQMRSASSGGKALARPPSVPTGVVPVYFDLTLPDRHAGRAIATMLDDRGTPKLLVVATERASHDRLERRIHHTLLAGIALALVLAVAIALLAVRRGLAPLLRFGAGIARIDGTQPPASLAATPLPRELEPFSRTLGSVLDRLYATIESERRFSRDVAHELRTPLAEIRTSIETAARAPADHDATRAAFATSIDAVERMQRAIDALLLLARQEAGLAATAVDPLDLPPLVENLAAALAAPMRERDIRLVRDLPAHLWVRSDVGALERIVSNLLRNAIEYAPRGSTLTIALESVDGAATLRIANPAPDLHGDDLPRLGQRFWRKSPSGGTAAHAGLGLALSRALARGLSLDLDFALQDGQLTARLGPIPLL